MTDFWAAREADKEKTIVKRKQTVVGNFSAKEPERNSKKQEWTNRPSDSIWDTGDSLSLSYPSK